METKGSQSFPKPLIYCFLNHSPERIRIRYSNSRKFGKIGWIKPLLNVMFASSLDAVNYQLDQVIADKYIRIQSQLKIASPDMDNITSKNIKSLQQEAKAMIEENQKVVDKFCDVLS